MNRRMLLVASAALMVAAPAFAYKLVPHGARVAVAKSAMTVLPAIDWNRQTARPGRFAEAWTLDGMPLNEVTFYGGIESGKTLFREVDKKNKPLPRFGSTMLATDIVQLFESSYRLAGGSALFQIDDVKPATFADQRGFRFTYHFTLENEEVRRNGEAAGAVIGGRLYMITYEAPAIHYYDRNVDDYRAIVATAKVPAPSVQVTK